MTLTTYLPQLQNTGIFFISLMTEMAVLFIGVTFLVGVIMALLPTERIGALLSARRGHGYVLGAGLGALTPFCSCSTVPLTTGLLRANAGFGPTMTFLFTSPLVNPLLITLLWMALGLKFTALYTMTALVLTIAVGYLLDHFGFQRYLRGDVVGLGNSSNLTIALLPTNDASLRAAAARLLADKPRLKALWSDALAQYRRFLPVISIGIAIGALTHGFVPEDFLISVAGADNPWAIPVAAVIGIPLYLRASTLVPMIMPLAAKGVALGAIAALIVGAAGASIPEIVMLNRMFRLPLMAAFLASVLIIAMTTGFAFQFLM